MGKNPIEEFIERLPFFKEFSAAEREKLVHTSGVFEKFNLAIQKKFQSQLIQILVERLDDMNEKFIKLKASTLKT